MNTMTSETLVKSAIAEFLGCWAAGGEATLSLSTQGGKLNFTTSNSLGSPGTPLHPPPPSGEKGATSPATPRRRRLRGPARRERDRQRAARFQATRATTSLSSSTSSNSSSNPLPMDSVAVVAEEEKAAEVHPLRTCKRCNLPCKGHPAPGYGEGRCQVTLDTPTTPENLRSSTPKRDLSSSSTLDHTREEECVCCGEVMSPDHQCGAGKHKCHGCGEEFSSEENLHDHLEEIQQIHKCHRCGEEFSSEENLTDHLKEVHPNMCSQCYESFTIYEALRKHTWVCVHYD